MRFQARIAALLILTLYVSLLLPAVHLEAAAKATGFIEDHFDQSYINDNWEIIEGSWAISSGKLTVPAGRGYKALAKSAELQDFTVETEISLANRNGDAGLLFRVADASSGADNVKGYYAGISAGGTGSVFLGRMNNNWTELKRSSITVNPNVTYRFKVTAAGPLIRFYVNDALVLEHTDTSYASGKIGVRIYQSEAIYDNLRIKQQDESLAFEDTFEDPPSVSGLEKWKVIDGVWGLQAGGVTVQAGGAGAKLLAKDADFGDATVETELKLAAADANAGLLFRVAGAGPGSSNVHGYYAGLSADGNVTLERMNGDRTVLQTVKALEQVDPNRLYQLKVATYGDQIQVYVEDMHKPLITVTDDSPQRLKSGGIGYRVERGQPVFDHFIASEYAVPVEAFKEPVANKAPLVQTPFVSLPLGSVKAEGWLLKQLELMKDGATGYAEDLYAELGSNSEWLGGTAPDTNWERPVYYVKGLVALAYTLNDPGLIAKSQKWVNWMLQSQRADGNFGPKSDNDWWPRMVAIYVLKDYYEATGDARVTDFLTKYFHYQLANLDQRPLFDWGKIRNGDNMNVVIWLYNRTGDASLLQLAEKLNAQGFDVTDLLTNNKFLEPARTNPDNFYTQHTVNVNQSIKTPAIYYQLSKNDADKNAYDAGVANLNRSHNQITGINAGTEMLSGLASTQGVELCAIVERIHSDAVTAMITGEASVGDALEKLTFNSLPGAMSKDIKTHQYYSLPNQIQSRNTDHGFKQNYDNGTVQSPFSGFPCCRFNLHMGWPYFVKDMWAATSDGGLGVIAYGPSRVSAKIKGADVTIREATNYPFEDQLRFTVEQASASVAFPLKLRIPAWTDGAAVKVNGEPQPAVTSGGYYTIERTWSQGDTVELTLPMKLRMSTWVNNSVGIERGPLVYSLKIDEKWTEQSNPAPQVTEPGFKQYNITADNPWNYGLLIDRAHPEASIQVVTSEMPDNPFEQAKTPVKLVAKGKLIPTWGKAPNGVSAAEPPVGPVYSAEPTVNLTLVPFGSENLRVTYFPEVTGDENVSPAKYEAEQAQIHNAKVNTNNSYASASSYVGHIDFPDSYVNFNEVVAPKSGVYRLYVWYAQNTGNYRPATARIIVNDGQEQHVDLAGTIGWGRFMATSVQVELQEGINSIKFMRGTAADAGFYELDYIALASRAAVGTDVDRTALQQAAADAQTRHDAAAEDNRHGYYIAGAKAALQSSIEQARLVAADAEATGEQVKNAYEALTEAVQRFEAKRINANLNGSAGVTIGDLAMAARSYGKQSKEADWDANAAKADVNQDGKVDMEDLAIVARSI
ncbi:beta-L-arabinofuranosidase domain-containing protein [Paenibacillus sp.]|uniref:beta-L-arabinofuranosidase domain-containing protein n=1 Tax=Paenibacillus sp. TaxID=58172 RepID=UPI003568C685